MATNSVSTISGPFVQNVDGPGSVALDPGQTHPSMGQVDMGQKVNGLTDPSVELVEQCHTDPGHLGFRRHGQNSQ
jgi:hypothetical protein